jgi:hypothetical protein
VKPVLHGLSVIPTAAILPITIDYVGNSDGEGGRLLRRIGRDAIGDGAVAWGRIGRDSVHGAITLGCNSGGQICEYYMVRFSLVSANG